MGNISFEREILRYLNIPNIPKKEFDGKTSFEKGVAIVVTRDETMAYAVASFDAERDSQPKIIKVFGYEPFIKIEKIFVVPSYIVGVDDVQEMDLDDASKKKAMEILHEADEIENESTDEKKKEADSLPEWIFPHIGNKDQAEAYIRSYRRSNGIKRGKLPQTEESLKNILLAIYLSEKNKKKN